MPFKSKAQERALYAKARAGEIPKATVAEFARATAKQHKKLPEHAPKRDSHYRRG